MVKATYYRASKEEVLEGLVLGNQTKTEGDVPEPSTPSEARNVDNLQIYKTSTSKS